MTKRCYLCNNKIKDNEDYCWIHNDKPKKMNKEQVKQEIKGVLKEYGMTFKTGYMIQLLKFRDDICKNFEKEEKRFKRIDKYHKKIMKIWEELYDEEYQVIPNKFKDFNKKKN